MSSFLIYENGHIIVADTTVSKLKKRPVSGPTTVSSTTVQVEQKGKKVTSEDSRAKAEGVSVSNPTQTTLKPRVSTKCMHHVLYHFNLMINVSV